MRRIPLRISKLEFQTLLRAVLTVAFVLCAVTLTPARSMPKGTRPASPPPQNPGQIGRWVNDFNLGPLVVL